jgi:hypothetical protein
MATTHNIVDRVVVGIPDTHPCCFPDVYSRRRFVHFRGIGGATAAAGT